MEFIYGLIGALLILLVEVFYMFGKSIYLAHVRKREVRELLSKLMMSESLTYSDDDGDQWTLTER